MPKRRPLLLAAVLTAISTYAAYAAPLGHVIFNGRDVILDDNGTWAYAPPGAAADATCAGNTLKSNKLPISFCYESPWGALSAPDVSFEYELVNRNTDTYVGLITERTQLNEETIEAAILHNAANVSGLPPEKVPVMSRETRQFNGENWKLMVYEASFNGSSFTFANYYKSLGDRGVAQLAFWCSTPYFKESFAEMEKVAATLKVEK
ncbi:MAG: hypothetical protein U1E15_12415 [Hyphomicrobiales bacterium]